MKVTVTSVAELTPQEWRVQVEVEHLFGLYTKRLDLHTEYVSGVLVWSDWTTGQPPAFDGGFTDSTRKTLSHALDAYWRRRRFAARGEGDLGIPPTPETP